MIKINLLPSEASFEDPFKDIFVVAVAAAVLTVTLASGYYVYALTQSKEVNSRLISAKATYAKYQDTASAVDRLESQKGLLEKQKM